MSAFALTASVTLTQTTIREKRKEREFMDATSAADLPEERKLFVSTSFDSSRYWLDSFQVGALFCQDKVWVDKERRTHRLEEMETSYLMNVANFIARNYLRWYRGVVEYRFLENTILRFSEGPPLGFDSVEHHDLPADYTETVLYGAIMEELRKR